MWDFLLRLIVVQAIMVGLIIFFLKKVLTKDTESSVNRLETSYEEVKKKKDELAKRLKEIEEEYNKKKEEAEIVAKEIKEKAQQEAYEIKEAAFKRAKVESEDIITKAQKTVDKIRMDIRKDIESRMVDRCGILVSHVLGSFARGQMHNSLVDEFIKELENTNLGTINLDNSQVDVISAMPMDDKQC